MSRRSLLASAAPQPPDIPVSTTEHDDPELAAVLATAPRYVDRKRAAELITRLFFPINHRTLERWPIAGRHVGGYFVMPTLDVLAEAKRRFEAAPVICGGSVPMSAAVHRCTPENLSHPIALLHQVSQPHHAELFRAVLAKEIALAFIPGRKSPWDGRAIPGDRPTVLVIGDDDYHRLKAQQRVDA